MLHSRHICECPIGWPIGFLLPVRLWLRRHPGCCRQPARPPPQLRFSKKFFWIFLAPILISFQLSFVLNKQSSPYVALKEPGLDDRLQNFRFPYGGLITEPEADFCKKSASYMALGIKSFEKKRLVFAEWRASTPCCDARLRSRAGGAGPLRSAFRPPVHVPFASSCCPD